MKLAEPSSLDSYQRGAYTTLDLSYRALPRSAQEFLHFISFFHHTDIPLRALEAAANRVFVDGHSYLPRPESHQVVVSDLRNLLGSDDKWNELQIQLTARTLRSASLISATSINDSIFLQIHPLIQSWSRDSVVSTSQHYRAMTIQVLTVCSHIDDAGLHRYLLPHILDILEQKEGHKLHINDMMSAGRLLKDQGHFQKATTLFEVALENMKTAADRSEEEVFITIHSWLAAAYKAGGRWFEAAKLEVEVLEQRTKILGAEHPYTVMASANLAATYARQGRLEKAEKLEVEVLEQQTRILGAEHPDTIRAAANLACTYRDQGRLEETEKLEVEILEQRTRILGTEHPETIMAAGNLAATYGSQGHLEAEKLEVEVLEQRTRILGAEHPDTILAVGNLAGTYVDQRRWEDAASLLAQAVQLSLKVIGQQHPDTQRRAADLEYLYKKLGKQKEAQEVRNLFLS